MLALNAMILGMRCTTSFSSSRQADCHMRLFSHAVMAELYETTLACTCLDLRDCRDKWANCHCPCLPRQLIPALKTITSACRLPGRPDTSFCACCHRVCFSKTLMAELKATTSTTSAPICRSCNNREARDHSPTPASLTRIAAV